MKTWNFEQIGPLDPELVEWVLGNDLERIIGVSGIHDLFTWNGKTLAQVPRDNFEIVPGNDGTPGIIISKQKQVLTE